MAFPILIKLCPDLCYAYFCKQLVKWLFKQNKHTISNEDPVVRKRYTVDFVNIIDPDQPVLTHSQYRETEV